MSLATLFANLMPARQKQVLEAQSCIPLSRHVVVSVTDHGISLRAANSNLCHLLPFEQVTQAHSESQETNEISCIVHGIIGLLRGFAGDNLICISKIEEAASLPSSPSTTQSLIYHIKDVLFIPLEKEGASKIVLNHKNGQEAESEPSSSAEADEALSLLVNAMPPSNITEKKQSRYDSLTAYLWPLSPTKAVPVTPTSPTKPLIKAHRPVASLSQAEIHSRRVLDSKIIRELSKELRRGMYFSYDDDPTHNLQSKMNISFGKKDSSETNLNTLATNSKPNVAFPGQSNVSNKIHQWQSSDSRFFWNKWLSRPLIDARMNDLIYPIFQGFVGQAQMNLDLAKNDEQEQKGDSTLDLCLISRRSVERPGLRYQRRGINSEGAAANFVETELLASINQQGRSYISSFVQTRGSIPLFWHQNAYALKPIPVIDRSLKDNEMAMKAHFDAQKRVYGPQIIVSLAEQQGKEAIVTRAYEKGVEALSDSNVRYVGFDFHQECKGMHYENISRLIDRIGTDLNSQNFLWCEESFATTSQFGVFRTNCMDCLDRTNVVQSALARQILTKSLFRAGINPEVILNNEELDRVFNTLWAENGDAISQEYAGSSALKGDFTRTGKRNMQGVWNDATNSLARLFQGTVNDFFKQSMLDFVLGINVYSFTEFQSSLSTTDPGDLHRLAAIRQVAIDTCVEQLIEEKSKLVAGWTVLAPRDGAFPNAKAYDEKVLLLTQDAVYSISYEYNLQKIRDFVKIPLLCLTGISHGTFIISTMSSFARDEIDNYGFSLKYHLLPGEGSKEEGVVAKENTYSMLTASRITPSVLQDSLKNALSQAQLEVKEERLVFKALRKDLGDRRAQTEVIENVASSGEDVTLAIVTQIQSTLNEQAGHEVFEVKRDDIRTLAEAERETSFLAKIMHKVEHLIWL